jgi:hypothetical protein
MQRGVVRANVERTELTDDANSLEQLFFEVTEGEGRPC